MNYTLITGASKGIGKAFAYECAGRGMNLILVARSEQLLKDLATDIESKHNIKVQTHNGDLLDHAVHKKIFEWVKQNGWNVNMLINNAGMGYFGRFDEKPLDKHLEVMHLNMDGMIRMAHEFLNNSDPTQRRYLLNTCSTGAFQPTPYMAVYCASKSFMLAFSQAIRYELRGSKVSVTALCPGGTESDFFTPAGMDKVIEKNAQFMMKADVVARLGISGLLKNKAVVVPGIINKVGAVAANLFPNSMVVPSAAKFFDV
ncbi:MAG TPA: SDR family oxidoreductase [Chitinophagales bacterium]|nr:SDR family oxidoreductase [Chitinophagales bacterium]